MKNHTLIVVGPVGRAVLWQAVSPPDWNWPFVPDPNCEMMSRAGTVRFRVWDRRREPFTPGQHVCVAVPGAFRVVRSVQVTLVSPAHASNCRFVLESAVASKTSGKVR